MTELERPPQEQPLRPRFQFSLRTQLIAVTAFAFLLGLLVVLGQPFAWALFHGIVNCVLPTPLVIAAIFARGELRTFAIGALVPWLAIWPSSPGAVIGVMGYSTGLSGPQVFGWMIGSACFVLTAAAACGALAVATSRWLQRSGDG